MRTELPARVRLDVPAERSARRVVELDARALVDPLDRRHRVADQVRVVHVDDLDIGALRPERLEAVDAHLEQPRPRARDLLPVITVGEGPRERRHQAAHRCREHRGVAVRDHQARLRVAGGELGQRDHVMRALEHPRPRHAAAL